MPQTCSIPGCLLLYKWSPSLWLLRIHITLGSSFCRISHRQPAAVPAGLLSEHSAPCGFSPVTAVLPHHHCWLFEFSLWLPPFKCLLSVAARGSLASTDRSHHPSTRYGSHQSLPAHSAQLRPHHSLQDPT